MSIREKFGNQIRILRLSKGMSQEELGFKSGLHRTYISEVERAIRNPTITTIQSISDALEVPLSEIFRAIEQ